MTTPTKEECAKCGVCCIVPHKQIGYRVILLDDDIDRLSEIAKDWVVDRGHRKALGIEQREDGVWACKALVGKLGDGAHCSIYENKPRLCREFESGNKQCLQARSRRGLQ